MKRQMSTDRSSQAMRKLNYKKVDHARSRL